MAQRDWMYSGWKRGRPTSDWVQHTNEFLDFAFSNQSVVQEGTIKCPCAVCRNYFRHKRGKVELHLCHNGFKSNYKTWTAHGERRFQELGVEGFGETDRMDDMLADLATAGPSIDNEEPTEYAQAFYRMIDSAEQLVHDKTTHSTLSATARLLSIKAQHNLSIACYDDIAALIHELIPADSNLPKDFYHSKKLLKGLGMPYEKIHKMRSFRHRRVNGVSDDNAAIDSTENGNGSNNNEDNEIGPVEEGSRRRKRGRTQPKRPPPGQRIPIKPLGEEQFEFVNYSPKKDMGIGGQVTALPKHEYPSMIEESRSKKYFAKTWAHYDIIEDEDGMTAADRFKEEFWSIYSVEEDLMPHAEYVLDRLAAKQCRNMMYELCVDAVKEYYDKFLRQRIKDSEACKKLLRQAQYAKVRPDWISEAAWRAICGYWCSPEYLKKRRLAQESRNQTDFAQNRGGSRPYAQTKQYLGKTYGPQAATDMNTFCSMKLGVKNCDSNGNSGPIPSQKAQQRVDDYFATLEAEHPDDCEQRRSDGQLDHVVLYKSSGHGLAHGRVPIANGAIRKTEMKGSGRRTNTTSQANSRSYQYLLRRNAQLEQNAQNSSHIGLVLTKHMKDVFEKLNMELPAEIVDILQSATANANASIPPVEQGTESSHAGHAGSGALESNGIEEDEGNANID